ncbi:MAG: class I SAM-dependent methyltransferase, partial [Planctomycetales bacterium]|nr:class I SAM-dependent methyltransferase [Planctomycetales bacterium]
GYAPFRQLPVGRFDGVICTDVLEHCPEDDVPWILGEIFAFARKLVFCNVACYPAQKRLPNGENAHCTVKSRTWWRELVSQIAADHPAVFYEITLSTPTTLPDGRAGVEKERLRPAQR